MSKISFKFPRGQWVKLQGRLSHWQRLLTPWPAVLCHAECGLQYNMQMKLVGLPLPYWFISEKIVSENICPFSTQRWRAQLKYLPVENKESFIPYCQHHPCRHVACCWKSHEVKNGWTSRNHVIGTVAADELVRQNPGHWQAWYWPSCLIPDPKWEEFILTASNCLYLL